MPRFLFCLLAILVAAHHAGAAPVFVTRAQAREYLLTKGVPLDKPMLDDLMQAVLPEIHEHTLLALAWEGQGRRLTPQQLDQLEQAHREIAVRLCRERRLGMASVPPVNVDDYEQLSRYVYFTSHILLADETAARRAVERLSRGESFAELARRLSRDPGSATLGGSLGALLTGQTVLEFEDALLRLRPGEVSPPVESPFGWHIIRLDSLRERDIEFGPIERAELSGILERHARHRAELEVQARLWKNHRIEIFTAAASGAGVSAGTIVAHTADTTLTRGQLDEMMRQAFGAQSGMATANLGPDFLRFWVEQDAWLREARRDGTWLSRETLDLVDLRERLLKSALLVNEQIAPAIRPTEEDLENYLWANPQEFLAERAFGLWTFEFPTREKARAARDLSRREKLDPAMLAERLGLTLHPRELSAEAARALPAEIHGALIDLDPDEWSDVMELRQPGRTSRWVFYSLIGRRLPQIAESVGLRRAVEERVRAAMITAEIQRTVEEMKRRTALTEVRWAS
ncbi:MAG: peptidylprolyl isomerase [bacterium]|nr:peptidylprolyl isomerase [bacterium]